MRLLLSTVTFFALLTLGFGAHANPSAAKCAAQFSKDHPLRLEVERLEMGVQSDKAEFERLSALVKSTRQEAEDLHALMGFREKNLFPSLARLLGGNTQAIANYRAKKISVEEFVTQTAAAKRTLSNSDQAVVTAIESWLMQNDAEFQTLEMERAELYKVVCAGNKCLRAIQSAMDSVSKAKTDDLIAGATDNKVLEMIASMDTNSAKGAIDSAKAELKSYKAQLDALQKDFGHSSVSGDHIHGVDPSMQLIVDLISGSSFMDFMNFFALSDVSNKLDNLRDKVRAVHSQVDASHDQLVADLTGRVCATRAACQAALP